MKEKEVVAYKGNYRKFIIIYFFISVILLAICAGFVIYIDPFYHYHAPLEKMKLIQEKEAYQNVGIARNCEYDAILTGSSMTENFKISQLNELFDCDTVKLSFSGGMMQNYEILFNEAFKNDKTKIKKVFYGCDIYAYIIDFNEEASNKIPEYLYDDNIFTDVEYLFNKEVLNKYAIQYLKMMNKNNFPNNDLAYNWNANYIFCQEAAIAQYKRPNILSKSSENFYEENVKSNFKKLEKFLSEHPDVEFDIFYPPYSILYYDSYNREGKLEALINAQEQLTGELLRYKNVKLSSFINEKDIICNLNNYKDYSHYSEKINEYILKEIKNGDKILTNENYHEYFNQTRNFLLNYDYEKIFENN